MAKHLARIHGTEEDKVNCPFYFKIGACRHADRCSRLHHRPAFSPTILIKHIYCHPVREAELLAVSEGRDRSEITVDKEKATEDFLQFFENMYEELGKFGRLDALHVCDNLGDHMVGHVYAKFGDEEEASDALNVMNGRFYDGRKMDVEFSPVTDFREARCRDFDEETCSRGGFCNFMHIKPIPMCLIRNLEEDTEDGRRRETAKLEAKRNKSSKRSRRNRDYERGSRREKTSSSSKRNRREKEAPDNNTANSGDDSSRSRSRSPNTNKRHRNSSRRSYSRSSSRSHSREGRKEDKKGN
mmetsp:Transcript_24925/g.23926  ORF Transcript_24925/g.23926 Transcript_24925/m.23926 type:complete len:299 (-) Transcript_24925:167-1063(-)